MRNAAAVSVMTLSIFHTREFFDLHQGTHYLQSGNTVMPVWLQDGLAYSPLRGTFGGFGGEVSLAAYEDIANQLMLIGAKEYRIKLAPSSHDQEAFALAFNVLSRAGFQVIGQELNYDQPINLILPLAEGNRKRLAKLKREAFTAYYMPIEEVYPVIAENRQRKGKPMSMPLDALMEMERIFPGRLHGFGITSIGGSLVAGAICIDLNHQTRYIFMWGDGPNMEVFSPVVLLANFIHWHSLSSLFSLLDAGTSTENGIPNYGLIQFKRSLGFRESLKLTMGLRRE
jgi:hypothetical protein